MLQKPVDRRLTNGSDCAQRAGDQVKFILNNQIRWQIVAVTSDPKHFDLVSGILANLSTGGMIDAALGNTHQQLELIETNGKNIQNQREIEARGKL